MATILPDVLTPRKLAQIHGRSARSIQKAAKRLGIPVDAEIGRYLLTPQQAELVLAATHDGPGQPSKKKTACGGKSRGRKSPRK